MGFPNLVDGDGQSKDLRITPSSKLQQQISLSSTPSELVDEFTEGPFRMNELMHELNNVKNQANAVPSRSVDFIEGNSCVVNEDDCVLEFERCNVEPKKINEKAKIKKKVFHFDGLSVEEAFNVPAPDVEWSKSENFYLFVKNYERKEKKNFDLFVEKEFKFSKNNPYVNIDYPFLKGLKNYEERNYSQAILYYEAAIQKDGGCILICWEHLIDCLHYTGQTHDAISLTKKCLPLNPNTFSRKLFLYLIEEQYYYQGCQVIFNWLKKHPVYCDIVPPKYKMEDKTSNLIDEENLMDLKMMLKKAAERCPFKVDYNVQIASAILLEISRDYSQSNDFWTTTAKNFGWQKGDVKVGINFLRNNEPSKAIEYLKQFKCCSSSSPLYKTIARCENALGLTYMYLQNYKKAGQCLLAAIDISNMLSDISWQKSWLHLSLCIELMRRDDLRNMVNEKDFNELCEEFDYQSITGFSNRLAKRRFSHK